jgi:hypothetical protein
VADHARRGTANNALRSIVRVAKDYLYATSALVVPQDLQTGRHERFSAMLLCYDDLQRLNFRQRPSIAGWANSDLIAQGWFNFLEGFYDVQRLDHTRLAASVTWWQRCCWANAVR